MRNTIIRPSLTTLKERKKAEKREKGSKRGKQQKASQKPKYKVSYQDLFISEPTGVSPTPISRAESTYRKRICQVAREEI